MLKRLFFVIFYIFIPFQTFSTETRMIDASCIGKADSYSKIDANLNFFYDDFPLRARFITNSAIFPDFVFWIFINDQKFFSTWMDENYNAASCETTSRFIKCKRTLKSTTKSYQEFKFNKNTGQLAGEHISFENNIQTQSLSFDTICKVNGKIFSNSSVFKKFK